MHADFSVELGHDDPALEFPWAAEDPSVRYYDLKSRPELVLQIPEAVAYPELGAFLTRINAPDSPLETAKCDVWQSREISAEEEIFGADQKFVSYIDLVLVDEMVRSSFARHEEFAKEICLLLGRAPDTPATIELIIRRCYFHRRRSRVDVDQNTNSLLKNVLKRQTVPIEEEMAANDGRKHSIKASYDVRSDRKAGSPNDPAAGSDRQASQQTFQNISDGKRAIDASGAFLRNACISGADAFPTNPDTSLKNTNADRDPNADPDTNAPIGGFYLTAYVTGFGNRDSEPRRQWEIAIALFQDALMQLNCG
jgi:hypothetical protein